MEYTLEQLKTALDTLDKETEQFLKNNSLVELPDFGDLYDKKLWGENYREDQNYYEQVGLIKSRYFGLKSLLIKLKNESANVKFNGFVGLIERADETIRRLESISFASKTRIDFYQNVMKVISNMSYGDY